MSKVEPLHIYLAGSWNRREQLQVYAKQLEELGHIVTSEWLTPGHKFEDLDHELTPDEMREIAQQDVTNIADANLFVAFTEPEESPNKRGGRHVEYGIVMGLSLMLHPPKDVAIVGPVENLFYSVVDDQGVFEEFDKLVSFIGEAYGHPNRETVLSGEQSQAHE